MILYFFILVFCFLYSSILVPYIRRGDALFKKEILHTRRENNALPYFIITVAVAYLFSFIPVVGIYLVSAFFGLMAGIDLVKGLYPNRLLLLEN